MNAWVSHQGGLKVIEVDVQSSIETQTGREGTGDLGNETIEVHVTWPFDIQVLAADIVKSFVIEAKGTIGVLQERVGGENRVVRFDDGGRNLGRWRNGEGKLGFASVVHGKTFEQERTETGSGTTSRGVEDKETLKTGTVVGKLADTIQDGVDDFFSNGVVTTSVVIGSILVFGIMKGKGK